MKIVYQEKTNTIKVSDDSYHDEWRVYIVSASLKAVNPDNTMSNRTWKQAIMDGSVFELSVETWPVGSFAGDFLRIAA